MKKTIKAIKAISLLSLITLAFVACDKDFSTLESEIQGYQNFSTKDATFTVTTYNKKIEAVQSNALSSNLLGVYNDDIYGLTTASVVTQATLSTYAPEFGDSPELVSVILTIPYYSTLEDTTEGESTYSMTAKDSLFGDSDESPIKLSIYKNGYFLRDIDPESLEESQKYYSNANTTINFDNHIEATLFETEGTLENPHFFPSKEEITLTTIEDEEEVEEKLSPRFRKELNAPSGYWESLFFEKEGMTELSNDNNFKNYFRGLYFKAEAVNGKGNLIMLNFNNAMIELNYTNLTGETDEDGTELREDQTLQINLNGNRLNLFENNITNADVIDAYNNPDEVNGDDKLYLKGGAGSMAIIDLFGNEDTDNNELPDDYETFIDTYKDQRLINEANLVFYVDETAGLNKEQEPSRVIIYDIQNNVPVIDYYIDSPNTIDPEYSVVYHSTVLERDSDGFGVKYKIRLTEHLNNILLRDSMNLKLGLMVTTNINEISPYSIFNSEDKVPSGTVMSPRGTVLHGSKANVPDEKRVKLEIFYTEPEN
ncbi:DUF4270 family protein [Lacinutrix sp. WUR7]|uniref:DUF4270 domain-containing protein n=1 Tax=Lacinutrix sp. WUR7 TaxID=2653681 RepID=UPI00193E4A1B|nr:DUF4270 domain-containing protein [Lacinutrix sp. WUR7]QRM88521.1 DUF4270 family protein [Lacinutrix sp. WUR7]